MTQRILIVGAGFAGMWSALAAARALDLAGRTDGSIEIVLVAPEPFLHVRPRFYEPVSADMNAPLQPLFDAVGVRYVQGRVDAIRTGTGEVEVVAADGTRSTLAYDRLVLAAGSQLDRPPVPGLREHAFSVDQLDDAAALAAHMQRLGSLPDSPARNTVVVAGGGFTGIETAAEMPARLRVILGEAAAVRVIVIERAAALGPELGPGPRPVIEQALTALGVSWKLGAAVTAIEADAVHTSAGERIPSRTVIWTAGPRASLLTLQIPATRGRDGRLHVDRYLRVPAAEQVFAAGDAAFAATDELGNHALMSCQHAMALGRNAGHNAACDLLGQPGMPYSQPKYVTCLDLGPWGAVYTEGWERQVKMAGAEPKALKRMINTQWIYPPPAERAQALAAADPAKPVVA